MMRSPPVLINPPPTALVPRLCLGLLVGSALLVPSVYQPYLDIAYAYLYTLQLYKSSTFETFWTVLCYAIIEPLFTYRFGHNPHLRLAVQNDRDTAQPKLPKLQRPSKRSREGLAPLLLLDLIMIKKFSGVPVEDMAFSGNYDPNTVAMRGNFLAPTLHRFTLNSPFQRSAPCPFYHLQVGNWPCSWQRVSSYMMPYSSSSIWLYTRYPCSGGFTRCITDTLRSIHRSPTSWTSSKD